MKQLTLLMILLLTIVSQVQAVTYTTIQLRRDTPTNWATYNPVLAAGETGCEMTGTPLRCTAQKVGDGVTQWSNLPYTSVVNSNGQTLTPVDIITKGPWVDVRAIGDLAATVASPLSAGKTILIASPVTVSVDLTIPADRHVRIIKGGLITISSGKTLTFTTQPEIGDFQAFAGSGTVAGLKNYSPRYWGAVEDGVTDDLAPVQKAIDSAYAAGGGSVPINGKGWGVSSQIQLKAGVYLVGAGGSDYYAGMMYYADTNDSTFGPRIKALAGFPATTPLINLPDDASGASNRRRSRGIRNLILDCNKLAQYGIKSAGSGTDLRTQLDWITVQGATSHGVYLNNSVAVTLTNSVVTANNGYGVFAEWGVSDSTFKENYIHTNQNGGLYFGDGSYFNRISGGKIEDNYGEGVMNSSTSTAVMTLINDVTFQNNNGPHIKTNGALATAIGASCFFNNGASTAGAGASKSDVYSTGGTIKLSDPVFSSATPSYHASAPTANGGKIIITNSNILATAATANYYQSVTVVGDVDTSNRVPFRANAGARFQSKTIAASSSGAMTFTNALEGGVGGAYFGLKAYLLVVQSAQYPQTPGAGKTWMGLVNVGKSGGAPGTGVREILTTSDATWIASVATSLSGNDLVVTVNTGASWGAVSGMADAYAYLVEIGANNIGL